MTSLRTTSIIYDLDGTLIDSFPGIEAAFRRAVAVVLPGREVPSLRTYIGPPIRGIVRAVFGELPEECVSLIEQRFRADYDTNGCLECALFPGVDSILSRLGELGLRQFVVTNKPAYPTGRVFGKFQLSEFIERFVAVDTITPRFASKSEATQHLLVTSRIDPEQCVLIGDSPDDAEAAASTGVRFIGVAYGYGSARLPMKSRLLSRFTELPLLLGLPSESDLRL